MKFFSVQQNFKRFIEILKISIKFPRNHLNSPKFHSNYQVKIGDYILNEILNFSMS